MIEIIPSINAPTFEEVQEKIAKIEPYAKWCHLDVSDGTFSSHVSWHNPADLPLLKTGLKAEAHLMVDNPERIIENWLVKPIQRVIVHLEAVKDLDLVIDKCKQAGIETGLAIRPETFLEKLKPWLGKINIVLILGVEPGPSGQKFKEEALDKTKNLRMLWPAGLIGVDGGLNSGNIKKAKEAGANVLIVSSAVFKEKEPGKAFKRLVQILA